jgi:hypothetical protein
MYQHSRPAPSHIEAFVAVEGYEEPKTVEEARALILTLGARLAKTNDGTITPDVRLRAAGAARSPRASMARHASTHGRVSGLSALNSASRSNSATMSASVVAKIIIHSGSI